MIITRDRIAELRAVVDAGGDYVVTEDEQRIMFDICDAVIAAENGDALESAISNLRNNARRLPKIPKNLVRKWLGYANALQRIRNETIRNEIERPA